MSIPRCKEQSPTSRVWEVGDDLHQLEVRVVLQNTASLLQEHHGDHRGDRTASLMTDPWAALL